MDLLTIEKAIDKGLESFKVIPPMRLSEWADKYFFLSAESSYVESEWKAYPYQVAILDCMSNDDIRELSFIKSARVGYTKMLLACVLYHAHHKRRNQTVWQPTDDDAIDFCKTEVETALRDVAIMEEVFPAFMRRHKDNTLKAKKFLGSLLHLRGGKAAVNYRRMTIDLAVIDELDGFDNDIEKEGSPVNLARKRIEGAVFGKLIAGSTPKIKNYSMIEDQANNADSLFRYKIPCPHCGERHELKWGDGKSPYGMKWLNDNPETVKQLCPSCHVLYGQADYLKVWGQGRWVDQKGNYIDHNGLFYDADGTLIDAPKRVAFHLWTAYSPQTTWAQIVREYLSAVEKKDAGSDSEYKTWVNTTLGETYEIEVDKTDEHALMQRAESYPLRVIPVGGLVLVAGVDVQDDRFEINVYAIGRNMEMWVIDYMIIQANPGDERDWVKLDNYLKTTFPHKSGKHLRIEAASIDTGGHYTHRVYSFVRSCDPARKIFAVKGDHQQGKPIKGRASLQDVNFRGRTIKNGIKLWFVGTDTAKDLLYGMLQIVSPGPGYIHFSDELPHEFYLQLTAEHRLQVKTTTGGDVFRWVKVRQRNEVLDCTIYAMHAAQMINLQSYTSSMWDRLEWSIQPPNGDLFATVENQEKQKADKADSIPPPSKRPEKQKLSSPQNRRMRVIR